MKAALLTAARRRLEESGPPALQARALTADVGASTQAVYTHFGSMPGLLEALVAEGFVELADAVRAVPLTEDPVADFFAQGAAYARWALSHAELYRLMFGLSGGPVFETRESREGLAVMTGSLERVIASGRIGPVDPLLAAGQFLSLTHGFVLLTIARAFGEDGMGLQVVGAASVNLMVGLGDERDAAERSLGAALARG
jgi:AcrR family transcriptional regulator